MQRVDSLEETLMLGGIGAGREGDNRGWDGWMASPTRWAWVWVNSGSWWWTGRPGVLRFMGSQRVGHDWATELNWWLVMLIIFSCAYWPSVIFLGKMSIQVFCHFNWFIFWFWFLLCGDPWVGKIPWRRKWQPTPVLLPGKSHGQRSLLGYSPWGSQRVGHDWLTSLHCMSYLHLLDINPLSFILFANFPPFCR